MKCLSIEQNSHLRVTDKFDNSYDKYRSDSNKRLGCLLNCQFCYLGTYLFSHRIISCIVTSYFKVVQEVLLVYQLRMKNQCLVFFLISYTI